MRSFTITMVLLLVVAAVSSARAQLIEGSDRRAEPFKKAVAALTTAIGTGSLERAKEAYVGDRADLELLQAYVDGVNAAKAMRAAIDAKFGADPTRGFRTFDEQVARTAVRDLNTVIFGNDPDRASTSANTPLGVGIEFKRVRGERKVLSLASEPATPEEHIARLTTYARSIEGITKKTNSGAYENVRDALIASDEAHSRLWPLTRERSPATRPGP
jgi:hypothetical protein